MNEDAAIEGLSTRMRVEHAKHSGKRPTARSQARGLSIRSEDADEEHKKCYSSRKSDDDNSNKGNSISNDGRKKGCDDTRLSGRSAKCRTLGHNHDFKGRPNDLKSKNHNGTPH